MHTYARDTWLGLTIWTRDDTELRVVLVAYKCTLALNTTLKAVSCGVLTKQTPKTDSHSIVQWKATRYAMVRWGTTCLTIDFLAIAPSDNPADMMTKRVLKDAFFRHRAVLLGSAPPPEPTQEAPSAE